jgi:hypothetical protein
MIKQTLRNIFLKNPSKANYKFILKDWLPIFKGEKAQELLETKRFCNNLKTIVLDVPSNKNILVISPHPDDDIFGAGGTLLQMKNKGCKLKIIYLSDIFETQSQTDNVRSEINLINSKLSSTYFSLANKIGKIEFSNQKLDSEIISFNPDIILIPFMLDDHPDHRNANRIFLEKSHCFKANTEVWAYQIYSTVIPNIVIDISNVIDQKVELMKMWKSVSGNRNWPHYIKGINAYNSRYIPSKNEVYGETFFATPLNEYKNLCQLYFSKEAN